MIDSASRRHFHEWILDIHSRLHTLKKAEISDDPIEYLTEQMIQQSWLICFDEFQVTDVADALLVRRLFTSMFEKGAVMVATSNRRPREGPVQGRSKSAHRYRSGGCLPIPFSGAEDQSICVLPASVLVRTESDFRKPLEGRCLGITRLPS